MENKDYQGYGSMPDEDQKGWEDRLNKILWDNLELKEEFQRPMKVTLQRDLQVFIRQVEQEAYERGYKIGFVDGGRR